MPRLHFMRHQVNNEDAVTFFNAEHREILTVVDAEGFSSDSPATWLFVPEYFEVGAQATYKLHKQIPLTADQVAELGRFCVEQFCELRPRLKDIENAAAYVRSALEDWNERARADEEHPPYDQLVARLDEIQAALRALEPVRRHP